MEKRGLLFILTGPSGAGKSTLIENILATTLGLKRITTATTRKPRTQEENPQRIFLSEDEFDHLVQKGAFVECKIIHGNKYGLLTSSIQQVAESEQDYITDIDVLSTFSLRETFPDLVIPIFVIAPSLEALKHRIKQRGYISDEGIMLRLDRAPMELSFLPKCPYAVINDNLGEAIEHLKSIIMIERVRRDANTLGSTFLNN